MMVSSATFGSYNSVNFVIGSVELRIEDGEYGWSSGKERRYQLVGKGRHGLTLIEQRIIPLDRVDDYNHKTGETTTTWEPNKKHWTARQELERVVEMLNEPL